MKIFSGADFSLFLENGFFHDDSFSHADVFGELADDVFTAQEAAEYLEVSIATQG